MDPAESPAKRIWLLAAITALGLASVVVTAELGSADDIEVCQATVYEGCPQRWDYLITGG